MKKTIICFVLAFVSFICSQSQNNITITGEIHNASNNYMILRDNLWKPVDTIQVIKGKINQTLNLPRSYYYLIYDDSQIHVFFEPGYNLKMTFNSSDVLGTISFSGDGSLENNYLVAKDKFTETIPIEKRIYSYYAQLDEEDFLKQTDEIRQSFIDFLKNYKYDLNPSFAFLETKSFDFWKINRLAVFEVQKRLITENPNYKVSSSYPNPFIDLDINETDFLITYDYLSCVNYYFDKEAVEISNKNQSDFFLTYMELLKKSNIKPIIKGELALYNAEYGFTYTNDVDAYYETFLGFTTTDVHRRTFQKMYYDKKNEGGNSSANFELVGIDGKTYSLNDFLGKYVYIDIWATWCAPCIKEIPYLKDLEEEFKEKVHFVSISWNDNKDRWKTMVKSKELSGIQLFSEDKNSEFFKFHNVEGLPRFILLDKEGKIINSKARQPSDPTLRSQLLDLYKS